MERADEALKNHLRVGQQQAYANVVASLVERDTAIKGGKIAFPNFHSACGLPQLRRDLFFLRFVLVMSCVFTNAETVLHFSFFLLTFNS